MMRLLEARRLHKTYRLGKVDVPVLRGANLTVNDGQWVAVLGASGSGKSTLLHLLGALDSPDADGGEVLFRQENIFGFSARVQNRYRNRTVGFVFQFYHLLPEMDILENTTLAAMVRYGLLGFSARRTEIRERAASLLASFGLGHRLHHRPNELSGGERQRAAIARALMNQPDLLLADEPTGNLDAETGAQLLEVIARAHAGGQTIVMVTHDKSIADRADRVVHLVNGRIEA